MMRNWGLSPDGSIESARSDEIQNELTRMRDAFVEVTHNEEDRLLAEMYLDAQTTRVEDVLRQF